MPQFLHLDNDRVGVNIKGENICKVLRTMSLGEVLYAVITFFFFF